MKRADWLSNPHWTPDTGMLTYLFLSNGTQANRDPSCPVQHSSQVQLMRGEFLKTALYWAGVVSVRLGAIAEKKKVSQHSCVWGSVWV